MTRLTNNTYTIFQQQTSVQLGTVQLEGDILHYILGLTASLHKIKQIFTTKKYKQQYVEEVGHFYWYLAGLCFKLSIIFNPFVPSPSTNASPFYDWARIEDRVASIADYYRQYLAEQKEFPSCTVEILIHEILQYLVNILWALDLDVEQCLKTNIAKMETLKDDNLKPTIEKELKQIKRVLARYTKCGRPTKIEKRNTEALTIGETWNDKENYPARRKRKPGVRVHKWSWQRTLRKYKQQREERIKT